MGLMGALRMFSGRKGKQRAVGTAAIVIAGGALLFATEVPNALMMSVSGGSKALAELVARSPGARIGGSALKAKAPRLAVAKPEAGPAAGPGTGAPDTPIASVLGGATGPAVPGTGAFPADFGPVTLPGDSLPGSAIPGEPGGGFGGNPILPPGGGGGIIIPGNPGGGVGNPGGPDEPGGPNPPPPVIPGVPEPSTWLMLIAGFGFIGHAMRGRRRVALG